MKAVDQPAKRSGQVAVFISRKENRLFVRQGFIPLFDMPVVIDEPDHPLGTHVFTAMAVTDEGAGMRWNSMTSRPTARRPSTRTAGRKEKGRSSPGRPQVQASESSVDRGASARSHPAAQGSGRPDR